MIRIALPLIFVMLSMSLPTHAQNNPPTFNETLTNTTITEGESILWFISINDPDPDDSISMFMDPPASDPVFKSYLLFENFDDTTWNFQFDPFYDFIESGQIDIPVTFYATDQIDTVSVSVTITVTNNNPSPILDPITSNFLIVEGVLFELLITASDPDFSIPILETSTPLPANATFTDSLNGVGLFSFLPDETQYGDSAESYIITFFASDADSTDGQSVNITVTGPNASPTLEAIEDQAVNEGDTLSFTVTATDSNATIPELSTSPLPDNAIFVDSGNGTGLFEFVPSYIQGGIDTVTFYAYDGEFTDSIKVEIDITDAGNQLPVFGPLPDTSFDEGGGTLEILITASDPEQNPVVITMKDTILNSSFDTTGFVQDTGLFSFTPEMNQGGTYEIDFMITDDSLGAETPGIDSITLILTINEVDGPPNLFVRPAGSQTVYEGQVLRIEWEAYDDFTENIVVDIFPPHDSAVFKGDMISVRSDSAGYLEFAPDYNFLQDKSDTVIVLTFTTDDIWDTVVQERVISVYDVQQDANDPLLADTLTLENAIWDDSIPGFKFTTRIWNDSAVAAAMLGFRWYDPWLQLDTIIFDTNTFNTERLLDSLYLNHYIYNDSLMFLTTFILFDSLYLDSGYTDYFTAYFKYDPDSIDIDTMTFSGYDTAKVGSSGEFFFDKRVREKSFKDATEDDLILKANSDYTYKPLVNFGSVRKPSNFVKMELFDVTGGTAIGKGGMIYARDAEFQPRQYEIRLLIENEEQLRNLSLDFHMKNDDGNAVWQYSDPVIRAVPTSRMWPDTEVWSASSGIQLNAVNMDGLASDSFRVYGMAPEGTGGLPAGLMQYMVAIPFTILDILGEEATFCFDTGAVGFPGTWLFTDTSGQMIKPMFDGGLCVKAQYSPGVAADRVWLEIYDVAENAVLTAEDTIYTRNSSDEQKQYQLRINLENKQQLEEFSLDIQIHTNDDGVTWTYADTLYTIDTTSRMYPDTAVWPTSSGVQFTETDMDGVAADTFRFNATAGPDSTGLPPGPPDPMIIVPFTVNDVVSDSALLCFDTAAAAIPGTWYFTDTTGNVIIPELAGICLPVAYSPLAGTDVVRLEIYDIGQDTIVGPNDTLYSRDAGDNPKLYEIRFLLENKKYLDEISLDFRIAAENQDVTWAYQEPVFRVDTLSRMYPDTVVWSSTSGLVMTGYGMDGVAADSFRFNGASDGIIGGMQPGNLQTMFAIPFTIENVTGDNAALCFDTGMASTPGTWLYTDTLGQITHPLFRGGRCLAVKYNPIVSANDNPGPIPSTYSLSQNFPNPFNPSTTIRFTLPRRENVNITVFNILGQVVKNLADGTFEAGVHSLTWDGRDNRGKTTASGIYLYRIVSDGFTKTRKMILLR